MTREEEIAKNAIKYEEHAYYSSHCKFEPDWRDVSAGFIEGAKWADQHPSIDTVKKIICYALKHTNIIVADDLENAVDWELLIKKAMEE